MNIKDLEKITKEEFLINIIKDEYTTLCPVDFGLDDLGLCNKNISCNRCMLEATKNVNFRKEKL